MARTLYKSNLSPHIIEHPGEIKGGKVKWYGDGEMYVVMGTEDRTNFLSLNKDASLTLTKATSTQKNELLNDVLVKERMDAEKVRAIRDKYSVWIISAQPSRAVSLLEEHECISKFIPNNDDLNGINSVIEDNIPVALKNYNEGELEGFLLPAWNIALLTDKEFFGQSNILRTGYIRRRKQAVSKKIDPNKMKPGDYVVHRNHGIGLFQKIELFTEIGSS